MVIFRLKTRRVYAQTGRVYVIIKSVYAQTRRVYVIIKRVYAQTRKVYARHSIQFKNFI